MDRPVLEVKNLKHHYDGRIVLEIEELKIYSGETLALLGPNGAGKSTLLRMINLLELPNQGDIFVFGKKAASHQERLAIRRKMTMVFQEPLLFDTSVYQNVAYGLKVRGFSAKTIKEKVSKVLEQLNLIHLASNLGSTLSSGEAKKVALARALVLEPKIFFLDEPLSSLDTLSKENFLKELVQILKVRNFTSVYVTHDPYEVQVLADRVAIMEQGKIVQIKRSEEMGKFDKLFLGRYTVLQ